jgi:hypothetical protein
MRTLVPEGRAPLQQEPQDVESMLATSAPPPHEPDRVGLDPDRTVRPTDEPAFPCEPGHIAASPPMRASARTVVVERECPTSGPERPSGGAARTSHVAEIDRLPRPSTSRETPARQARRLAGRRRGLAANVGRAHTRNHGRLPREKTGPTAAASTEYDAHGDALAARPAPA